MGETTTTDPVAHLPRPSINAVTLDEPWQWLAAGWKDLTHAPKVSLSYGLIFVVVSWLLTLLLFNGRLFFLVPPLAAGFFLVAPLLGIGMYSVSRAIEKGEAVGYGVIKEAWRSNPVHLSAMGLFLMFLLLVWMLAANLVFALFFDRPVPDFENFVTQVFLSGESPLFLLMGLVSGAVIALFTFAVSVVTVPLLMDRDVDVMTAVQTSLAATRQNWQVMLLWASLIAMFVGVGIFTFYIGLLVSMPLIGHATWHAYRDVVAPEQ